MVVLTHCRLQHRPDQRRLDRRGAGPLRLRRDRSSSCCRASCCRRPCFLAVGRGERHPSTRHYLWKRALRILPLYWVVVVRGAPLRPGQPGTPAGRTGSASLTLTQLYVPTLLPQLADPDVEPVHRGRVLRRAAADWLAFIGRRRVDGLHLPAMLVGAGAVIAVARRRLAGRGSRRSPAARATTRSGCPATCRGSWSAWCFAAVSADLPLRPREHLLDRLGNDLTGCWILAVAVFAHRLHPGRRAPPAAHARWAGRPAPRSCSTPSRARSSCCRWCSAPSARDGSAASCPDRSPFWLGDISYGVFAIHLFVHGRAVPGARHRAVHRPLPHDPGARRRDHPGAGDALVRYFERPILQVQERAAGWCGASPPRPRPTSIVPGTSTGARSAAADGGDRQHRPAPGPSRRPRTAP